MAPVVEIIEQGPDVYGRPASDAPATIETPGDVISPSQLTTWMSCQVRWAFRKVWNVLEPGTVAAAFGRAVHEATASVHNCQIETGSVLPVSDALAAFRTSWRTEIGQVRLTSRHNPEELRSRGEALVARYVREIAPSLRPAAAEVSLPKDAAINGVRVRGRIDLVEASGRIRDTKTICRKPGGMLTANRLQVTIYSMAMPGATGEVAVDYLVKTKGKPQLVQIEDRVTHRDQALASSLLQKAQESMRSGNYLPNRVADCCNRLMCGYADVCEAEFGGKVPMFPEAA